MVLAVIHEEGKSDLKREIREMITMISAKATKTSGCQN